jgi:hypothetical protein
MPYVSRDEGGNIDGCYANLQPGFAEELLPDDNPEVVAFLTPPPPSPAPETAVLYDHENRIRAQEGAPPLTLTDFLTKAGL